jgi:hypothetical protein
MANLTPLRTEHPEPPPTQIHFGMKILKNLGNFENITFEASVTDVRRHDESPTDAFARIAGFVERELSKQVDTILRELNG